MNLLKILFGDLFDFFPPDIRAAGEREFRALADYMNDVRDEWLSVGGYNGGLSVDALSRMIDVDRCDAVLLDIVCYALDAGIEPQDDERIKRQKYARATNWNRMSRSIYLIRLRIAEVTGIMPDILAATEYSVGWDSDNSFQPPNTSDDINYQGGFLWDSEDQFAWLTQPFMWSDFVTGILIDVKNDGNYTSDQLDRVYMIVAEEKPAELAAEVGYIDSLTGDKILLKTVYSKDLSQSGWYSFTDPGL